MKSKTEKLEKSQNWYNLKDKTFAEKTEKFKLCILIKYDTFEHYL
jgi:hypothetical protein